MVRLADKIQKIEDTATRDALTEIAKELKRISSLPPVTEDLKQLAIVVNQITNSL
jgi:hypothetical protein